MIGKNIEYCNDYHRRVGLISDISERERGGRRRRHIDRQTDRQREREKMVIKAEQQLNKLVTVLRRNDRAPPS